MTWRTLAITLGAGGTLIALAQGLEGQHAVDAAVLGGLTAFAAVVPATPSRAPKALVVGALGLLCMAASFAFGVL